MDRREEEPSPIHNIEVIEAPKRGRPVGSTNKRVPKATPSDVGKAGALIVGLANQTVITWMGPECGMLKAEYDYVVPSTERILARLPKSAAQAVSVYTDPFVILIALGLWATRITRIKDSQAKQKYQIDPREFARAGGESGSEISIDNPEESEASPTPIAEPDNKQNGQAKAASSAILRTVSPT